MLARKYTLKAMTAGEILDVGIHLARDNFKTFLITACLLGLPYYLVLGTVDHFAHGTETVVLPGAESEAIEVPLVKSDTDRANLGVLYQCIFFFGTFVIEPFTSGMLVCLAASYYLGKPITPRVAFGEVRALWPSLIGASILYNLIVVAGVFMLIAPGIYWALKYCLYPPLIVLEKRTAGNFFERSALLTKGNLSIALSFTAIFTVGVVLMLLVIDLIPVAPVKIGLMTAMNLVAAMVGAPTYVAFYYSCRCKNENFDLLFLAEQSAAGEIPASATSSQDVEPNAPAPEQK